MEIEKSIPLLDDILFCWKDKMGSAYQGYKNHVSRMVNICFYLRECNEEEKEKIIIAGAFHDIGIWAGGTMDYLPPSLPPLNEYLQSRNLTDWSVEIELMINEHHKIREYRDDQYPLVELFRKADLVDFSLGLFKFGVSKQYISKVNAVFPNAGFHLFLLKTATKWFVKNPTNPAPMMKW